MTTVAADHAAGVMVSDSKCTSGDVWSPAKKIWRHGNELIGVAGDMHHAARFLKWHTSGRRGPLGIKNPDFEALILREDGLFHVTDTGLEFREQRGFFAIGSGQKAAMAILIAGLGPVKAVEIACQVDISSGGEVKVEHLQGVLLREKDSHTIIGTK